VLDTAAVLRLAVSLRGTDPLNYMLLFSYTSNGQFSLEDTKGRPVEVGHSYGILLLATDAA